MAPGSKEVSRNAPDLVLHEKMMCVLRVELPRLTRQLEITAAQKLRMADSILRGRTEVSVEVLTDQLLPFFDDRLDEHCRAVIEVLAKEGVLAPTLVPTLFFELRNNTPYLKDNARIVRVYQALLEAYRNHITSNTTKSD